VLRGDYRIEWRDFADLAFGGYSKFRYLLVTVSP
jgi:hypothetical protein